MFESVHTDYCVGLGQVKERLSNGQRIPYPRQKFKNGVLKLNADADKEIIEMMKNVAGYGTDFHLVTRSQLNMQQVLAGEVAASAPKGGVTDLIKEDIAYLRKAARTFTPNARNKVFDLVIKCYEAFSIQGLAKPTKKLSDKRLKARIVELLGALEDNELIEET